MLKVINREKKIINDLNYFIIRIFCLYKKKIYIYIYINLLLINIIIFILISVF